MERNRTIIGDRKVGIKAMTEKSIWYRVYDLKHWRSKDTGRDLVEHQREALDKLYKWYEKFEKPSGGILTLPTGGGKTFTAERFLCTKPLSEGYKVLWLAHTHHLLKQVYNGLKYNVGVISEPKYELKVRVVSGAKGHFGPAEIKTSDDFIIATIQTIYRARKKGLAQFSDFLDAADGKLFVVLDEAHQAPAPTYRQLLFGLREQIDQFRLL